MLQPVHNSHTKKRGRPRKVIDPNILHEAFQKGRRIPSTTLASVLGVDPKTLRARTKELDIDTKYSDISDGDLDKLISSYLQERPTSGRSYIMGRLRSGESLKIQRHRITNSMNRVNQLGQGMRRRAGRKKKRTQYHVPRPHALWHIDGHHKLISWGFVIHGAADGYSRTVKIIASIL